MTWMLSPRSKRTLLPVAAGAFYLVVYLAWLLWARPSQFERFWTAGLAIIFTGLVVAVAAWQARPRLTAPGLRPAWNWLCAGLGLWSLADVLRVLFAASAAAPNRIVLPDVAWLAGAAAFLVGLLRYPQPLRPRMNPLRLITDGSIFSIAAGSLAWLVVLKPIAIALENDLTHPAALVYPAVNLLLLVVLLNRYMLGRSGSFPGAFIWMALALAANTFSDLSAVYLFPDSGVSIGAPANFGWGLGDAFMLLAIFGLTRFSLPDTANPPLTFLQRTVSRFQTLLPLVLVIALGWYTLFEFQIRRAPDTFGLWVTVILGMALIGRQGILAGEYEFVKYAQLVDGIAEPTFICSPHGKFLLVNPAFLRAADYALADDMRELPLQMVIHPANDVRQMLQAGLKQGWSGEVNLRRRNGQHLPVMLSLRPLPWSGRDRLALAGTAHDLTEIKRQQTALQRAYEEIAAAHAELGKMNLLLEQRVEEKTADLVEAYQQLERQNLALQNLDRLKSDFVSLVSHELRAPLTNINAGIELVLVRTRAVSEQVRSTLNLVQAEIVRLTHFIETILDVSALDAGRIPIYPGPLDLRHVVSAVQRQMTHLPGSQRVQWNVPHNLPDMLADERALTSVLFHLLDNALKYAPDGHITVLAGQRDHLGWIQIRDQGSGIPEDDLPLLFTRFFRAHPSDAQTVYGHGLGLYIVHRLVEAMNGKIEVTNIPKGGACFTCWLPLIEDEETGEEHELENTGS